MKHNRFMHSEPNRRVLANNADNCHVQTCQHTGNANIVIKTISGASSTVSRMGSYAKKCNKPNHFAQMCRSSAKYGTKQAAVHMMRYDSDSMYEDSSDDQCWSREQVVTLTLTPRNAEINVLKMAENMKTSCVQR